MLRTLSAVLCLVALAPPARAATIEVPGESPTIQAALEAAVADDSILVAPGTYTEPCLATAYGPTMLVMKSGVTLMSESGAEATILDGAGTCRVLLFEDVEGASVHGFTITKGSATGAGLYEDHGGGSFCFHSAPLVTECVFSANSAAVGGGFACDHPSVPRIVGCGFTGNSATDAGGGLSMEGASGISVADCSFVENDAGVGGAVWCSVSTPTFSGCFFGSNTAAERGGAARCNLGGPAFNDCTLAGNVAPSGGDFSCGNTSLVSLTRCTLYGSDTAPGSAAVVATDGSTLLGDRVIIAFGAGAAVACDGKGSTVLLSCCCIYGNAGGDYTGCVEGQLGVDGNIADDPLFCDAPHGDFTLGSQSPCAQDNQPDCGRIGAWPVGCESPTAAERATWGGIKARWRGVR